MMKLYDFHHLLPDTNDAALFDRFQRFAGLYGEDSAVLVHVCQDGAIGIHPLIAGEKGNRLIA